MEEKTEIQAVELVREIRDRQAELLAGKSRPEIIAFFAQAGEAVREEARRMTEAMTDGEATVNDTSRAEKGIYDEKENSEVRD